MWTPRLDPRSGEWTRAPYLQLYAALGILLTVVLLVAIGWVAQGQVERSAQQQAQASELRAKLSRCQEVGAGALVDRCRAQVRAGDAPAQATTELAGWTDAAPTPSLAHAGFVPVSLGLR